jgi:Na+/H+ antiporter NhaC
MARLGQYARGFLREREHVPLPWWVHVIGFSMILGTFVVSIATAVPYYVYAGTLATWLMIYVLRRVYRRRLPSA